MAGSQLTWLPVGACPCSILRASGRLSIDARSRAPPRNSETGPPDVS